LPRTEPFDRYPERYERWFEENRYAYESELLVLKEFIPEGRSGIEIGIGSGRFAAPLGIGLGVEPSREMRSLSKKRDLTVVDSIAEDLPFREGVFDFALMVTTICFIDEIERSFQEIFRILKPEGVFIIGFIDLDSPIGRQYQKNKESSVFYQNAQFYSVDEVIAYLKRAGFGRFSFRQTLFHPPKGLQRVEKAVEGYGKGSFVAIRAEK